jgi:hypothetical protein
MIIGVTHDHDGRVVQRLFVSTKVSIGLPPNGDCNHPTKLDHFVFLRKKRTSNKVEWEPDPDLTQHYGEQCRELHIILIDDDIENVFPSSYAWWTATERKCWGDGSSATRRTAEKHGGQPWPQCGNGCSELASGLCKPSGDLRFVLADFPRLGSVCRIHTSSYRSIRQIHSALQEIQTFTGGRLAGITAKLTVRPEEATYFDRKEKRKKTSSIWALSLEVEGDDMRKLIANRRRMPGCLRRRESCWVRVARSSKWSRTSKSRRQRLRRSFIHRHLMALLRPNPPRPLLLRRQILAVLR